MTTYRHWLATALNLSAMLWALIIFCMFAAQLAHADEAYDGPRHFHVSFRTETNVTEALWQAENVIDCQQTLRIARDPQEYREVGTMSLWTGAHPTAGQVYAASIVAAVAHYTATRLLENLADKHPQYRALARVWSYGSLGYKTWNMERNARVELGY